MAVRRLDQIVALVEERGFVSVKDLSTICRVSEVTIRRDLETLERENRLQRTFGGAYALVPAASPAPCLEGPALPDGFVTDRVDVLVATPVDPLFDRILLERAAKRTLPVIAESLTVGSANETLVAVDNFQAAAELGRWVGTFAQEHFAGRAAVLDLTFKLSNTRERSRGFMAGLRAILPDAQPTLVIDAGSTAVAARQLTADALTVHPEINVIFAINDATALGAIEACQECHLAPEDVLVVTFGLEGETLRRELAGGGYCKAGLAMFPEIVGPVCVEAAIAAYNNRPLPPHLITPHAVLTAATMPDFYSSVESGCRIRWDAAVDRLRIPLNIDRTTPRPRASLPGRMGLVVPFMEHEWYGSLITCMQEHAGRLGIEFETANADQILRDDRVLRQRSIAELAAAEVQPGEVILLDGDPLSQCLAEALARRHDITVITNSLPVCEILRQAPNITLISTGGMIVPGADSLSGPTAEAALRDLRADKLFLTVTGVSLSFGLSHANLSQVAVKQAMIRAAREVVLLADHARFGQEAVGQVAPLTVVQKLITDNALPAGIRLELNKLGINVLIAKT